MCGLGSCRFPSWSCLCSLKTVRKEKSFLFSAVWLLSGSWSGAEEKGKKNSCYYIVFNIEQLLFQLLLFIYSYMCILAWLTSAIEFVGFILLPSGDVCLHQRNVTRCDSIGSLSSTETEHWNQWVVAGREGALLAKLSRPCTAPVFPVSWSVPGPQSQQHCRSQVSTLLHMREERIEPFLQGTAKLH